MVCPPTSPSSVFTAECTGFSAAAACVVQYQLVAIRANDTCTDVSAQDDHWKVSLQRTLNFSAEVAALVRQVTTARFVLYTRGR